MDGNVRLEWYGWSEPYTYCLISYQGVTERKKDNIINLRSYLTDDVVPSFPAFPFWSIYDHLRLLLFCPGAGSQFRDSKATPSFQSPSIASSAKLPTSASLYSDSCDPLDNGLHNGCSSTGGCRRYRCAARTASLRSQLCILPFGWCKLRQRERTLQKEALTSFGVACSTWGRRPLPCDNHGRCHGATRTLALKIWSAMAILCIRNYWLVQFMRNRL